MRIPYCFFPESFVKRGSKIFLGLAYFIKKSKPDLDLNIKRADLKIETTVYLSSAIFSDFLLFVFSSAFLILLLLKLQVGFAAYIAIGISLMITLFIFMQQMTYPRVVVHTKVRHIEKSLLSALRTMQIQISSGIPVYSAIASISNENYGGVSEQFKKAVKEISTGTPQVNALESLATNNPSIYFQRVIWQIVTAMKSGADLGSVLSEIIQSLSEEQIVEVQDYGSKLNPLTMFYMLIVVIVPALALTFFVVLGSFLSLSLPTLKGLFWGMFGIVLMFQFIFISMISSKRPNLL